MIALDASVVVELLTNGSLADSLRGRLAAGRELFIAPYLLDLEVESALRGLAAGQRVDPHLAQQILVERAMLPVGRYPHTPLLMRIWELRHNFTCYDVAYVALAEITESVLYTCDVKQSKGHRARVVFFR